MISLPLGYVLFQQRHQLLAGERSCLEAVEVVGLVPSDEFIEGECVEPLRLGTAIEGFSDRIFRESPTLSVVGKLT